ncbi:hypothetical protein P5673_033298 [Acropora cervicornis]|uniref:Uncharacterized protein n=1 Tax=Acropora cervicornis TaxID=6130 RepID=A0AAD9URF6_ACRCE|nr:hypothetical protein P5673_033298 [Acropora cervicornis]
MKDPTHFFVIGTLLFVLIVISAFPDVTIPHPSAWFPLNGTYDTSEIENRTTSGSRKGKVYLSLGPDGKHNGSYFFGGSETASTSLQDVPCKKVKFMKSQGSSIIFSKDSLDLGVPKTILFWLYTYDSDAENFFLQYGNIKFSVHDKTIQVKKQSNLRLLLTGILAEKGWTFVGLSYNKTSAEAQLWFDGNMVNSTLILPRFDSQRSRSMTLGGNCFKGKITQLMFFDLTLTKEQIRGIKGRMKLPVMILNSTIILNNPFYRAELASFLAPAVESTSGPTWGETLNAFIFSLNNSGGLPPFKCFAKNTSKAIYKNSSYGPSFGEYPGLRITCSNQNTSANAQASISKPYSAPSEVDNNKEILAGTSESFFPDSYDMI